MEQKRLLTPKRVVIGLVILMVSLMVIVAVLSSSKRERAVTDPNTDSLQGAEDGGGDGKIAAALYQSGDLYTAIEENNDVWGAIQKDILLFARTTRPEFKSPDVVVGFTFDKGFKKDSSTFVFTGRFYGLEDKIQVRVTPHGSGVYTLSITNLKDGTNIDGQLSLNGKRNKYITTLPIDKSHYSIRYQQPLDRIVVSFYDGYTSRDVDEVVASVSAGLGTAETKDVVYSLNKIGIVSLDEVRQNLVTPLPAP